jgi:hypothetical protein
VVDACLPGLPARARHVDVTTYDVDKLFWLMGSGYFYDDPHVGNGGRIGSQKKRFIEVARSRLEEMREVEAPSTT